MYELGLAVLNIVLSSALFVIAGFTCCPVGVVVVAAPDVRFTPNLGNTLAPVLVVAS